jgi:hypothetical protein
MMVDRSGMIKKHHSCLIWLCMVGCPQRYPQNIPVNCEKSARLPTVLEEQLVVLGVVDLGSVQVSTVCGWEGLMA